MTDRTSKPLACPWCGVWPINGVPNRLETRYSLGCVNPSCEVQPLVQAETTEECVRIWNKRTPDETTEPLTKKCDCGSLSMALKDHALWCLLQPEQTRQEELERRDIMEGAMQAIYSQPRPVPDPIDQIARQIVSHLEWRFPPSVSPHLQRVHVIRDGEHSHDFWTAVTRLFNVLQNSSCGADSPVEPTADEEIATALVKLTDDIIDGQTELDTDAKRALYGNLKRLYRRSDVKASGEQT